MFCLKITGWELPGCSSVPSVAHVGGSLLFDLGQQKQQKASISPLMLTFLRVPLCSSSSSVCQLTVPLPLCQVADACSLAAIRVVFGSSVSLFPFLFLRLQRILRSPPPRPTPSHFTRHFAITLLCCLIFLHVPTPSFLSLSLSVPPQSFSLHACCIIYSVEMPKIACHYLL